MPTTGYYGMNALLKMGDGATPTEVFTTVAAVNGDLPMPDLTQATAEITSRDSTGGYDEFIPTIKSAGEIEFDLIWDPANATHGGATGLLALYNNQTKRNFQITLPSPLTQKWSFAAYVTGYQATAPQDGAMTATVKLKLTGAPTLA